MRILRSSGDVQPFLHQFEPPHPDESLLGLLVRACEGTTVLHLSKALGLAAVKHLTPAVATALSDETEIAGLAKLLRTTPAEIVARTYPKGAFEHTHSETVDFFGVRIRAQYRRFGRRRVAPRALAISNHHRAIWDIAPFSFDPETMETLLANCPKCGRDLGWKQMRGVAYCERCIGPDGLPNVDLRSYPAPVIEIADPEALQFVVGLVHPLQEKRRRARALLPEPWSRFSNSDLFEVVMALASGLLAEPDKDRPQGRRGAGNGWASLTPHHLALAGRAVLDRERGFGALAEEYRKSRATRPRYYGLLKEFGPLARLATDRYLTPQVRKVLGEQLGEYVQACELAATASAASIILRKGTPRGAATGVESGVASAGKRLCTVQELSKLLGTRPDALRRLANSGMVQVVCSDDAMKSPVRMWYHEVAPVAAEFADSIVDAEAAGTLGIPRPLLAALSDWEKLERLKGPVLAMTHGPVAYRRSSVERLRQQLWSSVISPPPAKAPRLKRAASFLGVGHPPWLKIILAILEGRLEVFAKRNRRSKVLKHLFVRNMEALAEAVWTGAATKEVELPEHIDICTVSGILGVNETFVWRLAKKHPRILPKHNSGYTPFLAAEVKKLAVKYAFVPEISKRTGIAAPKVRAWLRKEGVEEVAALQKNGQLVFLRALVEPHILKWTKTHPQDAAKPDYSTAKIRIIQAAEAGVPLATAAKREGVGPMTARNWVKNWNSRIVPLPIPVSSKLDAHAVFIRERAREGISQTELYKLLEAKNVGVTRQAMLFWLKKHGVVLPDGRSKAGQKRIRLVAAE